MHTDIQTCTQRHIHTHVREWDSFPHNTHQLQHTHTTTHIHTHTVKADLRFVNPMDVITTMQSVWRWVMWCRISHDSLLMHTIPTDVCRIMQNPKGYVSQQCNQSRRWRYHMVKIITGSLFDQFPTIVGRSNPLQKKSITYIKYQIHLTVHSFSFSYQNAH